MALTAEQDRFLWLHQDCHVVKWQWLFQGTQLRAYSDTGRTATISKSGADDLVRLGLMEWGVGGGWVRMATKEKVA